MAYKLYLFRMVAAGILTVLMIQPLNLDAGIIGYGVEFCGNCSEHAQCRLNGTHNGVFVMECRCEKHYDGDGINCNNIDECAKGTDNCDSYAICTDKDPGFNCTCPDGFSGDGVNCEDIDECKTKTHRCDIHASCTNTKGSYECQCIYGYTGNGTACSYIDECKQNSVKCPANAECKDMVGNYSCHCVSGYAKSNDTLSCVDIDECTSSKRNCDKNAHCSNNDGSFVCKCAKGFTGNGSVCTDIDECLSGYHSCDEFAKCSNTIGSFTCECVYGFTGNGSKCTEVKVGMKILRQNLSMAEHIFLEQEMEKELKEREVLELQREYYRRRCSVKEAAKSKQAFIKRIRRIVQGHVGDDLKMKLQRLKQGNSELALQIEELILSCNLDKEFSRSHRVLSAIQSNK